MSVSLCCCGGGGLYTAVKFGAVSHYRYGEPVFDPGQDLNSPARNFRQIGRRFRRIEAEYSVRVTFPSNFAGGSPVDYTITGSASTQYNRYTGTFVDAQSGDYLYVIRSLAGTPLRYLQAPGLASFWEFQGRTGGSSVADTTVSQTWVDHYRSFRGDGYITYNLAHRFTEEATLEELVEDCERLLGFLDLDALPWPYPDPAETALPGHLYGAVYYARFTDGRGTVGLGSSSSHVVAITGRTRYLNRPLLAPDTGGTGPVADMWAGLCVNPTGDLANQPRFYLGTVSAAKALVVTSQGPLYGVTTLGGIGEALHGDACAPITATGRPLFVGATQADLDRYPDRAHVHDWEDMVTPPSFLQVSRLPC